MPRHSLVSLQVLVCFSNNNVGTPQVLAIGPTDRRAAIGSGGGGQPPRPGGGPGVQGVAGAQAAQTVAHPIQSASPPRPTPPTTTQPAI